MDLLKAFCSHALHSFGVDSMVNNKWDASGLFLFIRLCRIIGAASWHVPLSNGVPLVAPLFPNGTTAADVFVWGLVLSFIFTLLIPW